MKNLARIFVIGLIVGLLVAFGVKREIASEVFDGIWELIVIVLILAVIVFFAVLSKKQRNKLLDSWVNKTVTTTSAATPKRGQSTGTQLKGLAISLLVGLGGVAVGYAIPSAFFHHAPEAAHISVTDANAIEKVRSGGKKVDFKPAWGKDKDESSSSDDLEETDDSGDDSEEIDENLEAVMNDN